MFDFEIEAACVIRTIPCSGALPQLAGDRSQRHEAIQWLEPGAFLCGARLMIRGQDFTWRGRPRPIAAELRPGWPRFSRRPGNNAGPTLDDFRLSCLLPAVKAVLCEIPGCRRSKCIVKLTPTLRLRSRNCRTDPMLTQLREHAEDMAHSASDRIRRFRPQVQMIRPNQPRDCAAVSYTHLTLPTICSV